MSSENYMMIDGKRIDISKETAENLKKKFGRKKLSFVLEGDESGDLIHFVQINDRVEVCIKGWYVIRFYPDGTFSKIGGMGKMAKKDGLRIDESGYMVERK